MRRFVFLFVSIVCLGCSPSVPDETVPDLARTENGHQWKQDFPSELDPSFVLNEDGDTINKVDDRGMLQGAWIRMHPDGSFKCKGRYRDGLKEGYWERKWPNGNWRYPVNMKSGYQHGLCKHYYENGNLKTEGEIPGRV